VKVFRARRPLQVQVFVRPRPIDFQCTRGTSAGPKGAGLRHHATANQRHKRTTLAANKHVTSRNPLKLLKNQLNRVILPHREQRQPVDFAGLRGEL
jgi:hypothetical protein